MEFSTGDRGAAWGVSHGQRQHLPQAEVPDEVVTPHVGSNNVGHELTDADSLIGRGGLNLIPYGFGQSRDGHDTITFVWLGHVLTLPHASYLKRPTRRKLTSRIYVLFLLPHFVTCPGCGASIGPVASWRGSSGCESPGQSGI